MHRSFTAQGVLASIALGAALSAQAQTSATTTLSNFRILTTALSPSDDGAPSLSLVPGALSTAAVTLSNVPASWLQQGDSAFGPASTSGSFGDTGGAASFDGDPLGSGGRIAASAFSGPSRAAAQAVGYVEGPPGALAEFVLAARTQVTFAGSASVDWDADNPEAATYGLVDLSFWQIIGDAEIAAGQSDVGIGYMGNGEGALSGSSSSPFELTFVNDSDAAVVIGYQLAVRAFATDFEAFPMPVDEPGSAGLLLAGCFVLSTACRRHRRPEARVGPDRIAATW